MRVPGLLQRPEMAGPGLNTPFAGLFRVTGRLFSDLLGVPGLLESFRTLVWGTKEGMEHDAECCLCVRFESHQHVELISDDSM